MIVERMELTAADRVRYFVPTVICAYLSVLCLVLIVTSVFLVTFQNAVTMTAAGVFGLLLTGGLGLVFWRAQRRDLRYVRVATPHDAPANFAAVRAAATLAGWRIVREEPARRLDAETPRALLDAGERIAVRFVGADVLVASICDPRVGFSLVGRRHCEEHRDLVRRTVASR